MSLWIAVVCYGCLSICRVHSLLAFLHVCVKDQIFPSIGLSCESCVGLCNLLASLMNWLQPWCVGGLLDRCPLSLMSWLGPSRVRVSARWGGVSACPLTGPCRPPYDCVYHTGTLFPLCRKGYADVLLALDHFSLSSFLLSFHQECITVFSALWVCLYPGISPLGKKALYHCNVCSEIGRKLSKNQWKIVHNAGRNQKLSTNHHWIPLLLTP